MKLFSKKELENLVVLDIETVSGTKDMEIYLNVCPNFGQNDVNI